MFGEDRIIDRIVLILRIVFDHVPNLFVSDLSLPPVGQIFHPIYFVSHNTSYYVDLLTFLLYKDYTIIIILIIRLWRHLRNTATTMIRLPVSFIAVGLYVFLGWQVDAFHPLPKFAPLPPAILPSRAHHNIPSSSSPSRSIIIGTRTTRLFEKKPEYSRELYLREEAESPFRKVRFFLYLALGGGALTSLVVSLARVAAAVWSGINTELLPESAVNVAVDLVGLVVLAFLYKNDLASQESRLQRAFKGAALAKLTIRASKNIILTGDGDLPSLENNSRETFTTTLASLRRGRGIEKRVVIAVAGPQRMSQVIHEAKELQDELMFNDLLIIPYILGSTENNLTNQDLPDCVALPQNGAAWKSFVDEEVSEATRQGVDAKIEGVSIILKKNGRIGQVG